MDVRGRCARCGEFSLSPSQVCLIACGTAPRFCLFSCPSCGRPVRQDVSSVVARALVEAGVRTIQVTSEKHPDGPALTEDDLIAFGRELEAGG